MVKEGLNSVRGTKGGTRGREKGKKCMAEGGKKQSLWV